MVSIPLARDRPNVRSHLVAGPVGDPYPDAWRQVVRAHSTVCYRDGIRKLYGFLSGLSFNESYLGHASVSVTFTESESDPGDLLALLP